jgi:hypothetical protein
MAHIGWLVVQEMCRIEAAVRLQFLLPTKLQALGRLRRRDAAPERCAEEK